jgi:hypothetical protein
MIQDVPEPILASERVDQPHCTKLMSQMKTDAIALIATEMCNVHNIIIRGINSILRPI